MMAKPIIALVLHYPMIQFLLMTIIRYMAIYPVDSAIQCLNNRAKYFCLDTTQIRINMIFAFASFPNNVRL